MRFIWNRTLCCLGKWGPPRKAVTGIRTGRGNPRRRRGTDQGSVKDPERGRQVSIYVITASIEFCTLSFLCNISLEPKGDPDLEREVERGQSPGKGGVTALDPGRGSESARGQRTKVVRGQERGVQRRGERGRRLDERRRDLQRCWCLNGIGLPRVPLKGQRMLVLEKEVNYVQIS